MRCVEGKEELLCGQRNLIVIFIFMYNFCSFIKWKHKLYQWPRCAEWQRERERKTRRCFLGLPQEISCIWREIPRSATIDANVMMHKSLIVSSRDVGSDTWSLPLSQTPQIMPIAHVWTETWQLHKNLWHTQFPSSRYWFNFFYIYEIKLKERSTAAYAVN